MKMKNPILSVIIPIGHGRKMYALESLKSQEVPVEIIVQQGTNPSKNRNIGAKKAKGDILAFIDAHTILPKDWSKKIIQFFDNYNQIDMVGGPQLTLPNEKRFGKISGYALSSIFGAAKASTRYRSKKLVLDADENLLTSANLVCRKKVFDKVSYNESIYPGEDPKLIEDTKEAGFNVAYDPNMVAYHKRRENVRDFAIQIFKYGLVRPKKENLIKTFRKIHFLAPSTFIFYLILFPILSVYFPIFLLPILAYVSLMISFSFVESLRNNDLGSAIFLPFIFFVIHISYGLGFVTGMLKEARI